MARLLLFVLCRAFSFSPVRCGDGPANADAQACEATCRELLQRRLAAAQDAHRLEMSAMISKYERQLAEERAAWLIKVDRLTHKPRDVKFTERRNTDVAITGLDWREPERPGVQANANANAKRLLGPEQRSAASRQLLEADPSDKACSKDEVQQVLSASDPTPVVMAMLGTNAVCALCIIPCASTTLPDALVCLLGCQHQRENRCDTTTGLERVAPLIEHAATHDRSSLIALLEVAEAVRRVFVLRACPSLTVATWRVCASNVCVRAGLCLLYSCDRELCLRRELRRGQTAHLDRLSRHTAAVPPRARRCTSSGPSADDDSSTGCSPAVWHGDGRDGRYFCTHYGHGPGLCCVSKLPRP